MSKHTTEIPTRCAHGVHNWDKVALANGHHMCTDCPMWLERSIPPHLESVQIEIKNPQK